MQELETNKRKKIYDIFQFIHYNTSIQKLLRNIYFINLCVITKTAGRKRQTSDRKLIRDWRTLPQRWPQNGDGRKFLPSVRYRGRILTVHNNHFPPSLTHIYFSPEKSISAKAAKKGPAASWRLLRSLGKLF